MQTETPKNSADSTQVRVDCALGTWLPIETAPRDGTPILGVQFCKYLSGEAYVDGAVMMWEGGSIFKGQWAYMGIMVTMVAEEYLPTHWMPLPLPPST